MFSSSFSFASSRSTRSSSRLPYAYFWSHFLINSANAIMHGDLLVLSAPRELVRGAIKGETCAYALPSMSSKTISLCRFSLLFFLPLRRPEFMCCRARRAQKCAQYFTPLRYLCVVAPLADNEFFSSCFFPFPHSVAIGRIPARNSIFQKLMVCKAVASWGCLECV